MLSISSSNAKLGDRLECGSKILLSPTYVAHLQRIQPALRQARDELAVFLF
jgi:hypothetical protein